MAVHNYYIIKPTGTAFSGFSYSDGGNIPKGTLSSWADSLCYPSIEAAKNDPDESLNNTTILVPYNGEEVIDNSGAIADFSWNGGETFSLVSVDSDDITQPRPGYKITVLGAGLGVTSGLRFNGGGGINGIVFDMIDCTGTFQDDYTLTNCVIRAGIGRYTWSPPITISGSGILLYLINTGIEYNGGGAIGQFFYAAEQGEFYMRGGYITGAAEYSSSEGILPPANNSIVDLDGVDMSGITGREWLLRDNLYNSKLSIKNCKLPEGVGYKGMQQNLSAGDIRMTGCYSESTKDYRDIHAFFGDNTMDWQTDTSVYRGGTPALGKLGTKFSYIYTRNASEASQYHRKRHEFCKVNVDLTNASSRVITLNVRTTGNQLRQSEMTLQAFYRSSAGTADQWVTAWEQPDVPGAGPRSSQPKMTQATPVTWYDSDDVAVADGYQYKISIDTSPWPGVNGLVTLFLTFGTRDTNYWPDQINIDPLIEFS